MIGARLDHYEVTAKLGEGGMGTVYRATDVRLGREVALKMLPAEFASQPERVRRFEREARVLASLNHPHVAVIHGFEEIAGRSFLVMELVEGEDLARRLDREQRLDPDEAIRLATQIAEALAHAHSKSIVHRDLKPANVIITSDGHAKVLDFGLARLMEEDSEPSEHSETARMDITRTGAVMGSPPYMSPEQAQGLHVDARTDVFSFGALLYEMLAGRRPFPGTSSIEIASNILNKEPEPITGIPRSLAGIVERCLAKDPAARPDSAELARALHRHRVGPAAGLGRLWIPAAAVTLVALAAGGWLWRQTARERWAREEALPQIERLIESTEYVQALELAERATAVLPEDPQLRRLLAECSYPASISTEPPGVRVSVKQYRNPESEWVLVGTTPLTGLRLPDGFLRIRLEKDGYETLERSFIAVQGQHFELTAAGTAPDGMVRVSEQSVAFALEQPKTVPAFWIDRYELTNAEYQRFIAAGGYERPEFWKHPFLLEGRELSRDEAMKRFHDRTGRPGPATWDLGSYPEGEGQHPVGGISWYEAAAYAEFAGKSLPSVYHWQAAAEMSVFSDILLVSNIGGESKGPAPVGSYAGLGPFGTYDMAGNVREWCANSVDGERYLLGGRWLDPPYRYRDTDGADPFDRSPGNGVRLALLDGQVDAKLMAPVADPVYDFSHAEPVDDATFEVFRRFYAYDAAPLEVRIDSVEDTHPHWRQETVSFEPMYAGERVRVHIFLPRNASPPFQPIVFFPHAGTRELTSSRDLRLAAIADWVPRSGRALVYPIYEGTYERGGGQPAPTGYARRDQIIHWSKDVQRTVDYLEIREDIDADKLGYYGISLGAEYGPIHTAIDDRFRASVLVGAHLHAHQMRDTPEIQPLNFGSRSRVPVLMISGRDDFYSPLETSLRPMLELQGAPDADKELVVLEGGHVPTSWHEVVAEALRWFDRYLGPVSLVDRGP